MFKIKGHIHSKILILRKTIKDIENREKVDIYQLRRFKEELKRYEALYYTRTKTEK